MANYYQPFNYITLQVRLTSTIERENRHVLVRISTAVLLQTTHPHCKQRCCFAQVSRGQNACDQIAFFAFHTFVVEDSIMSKTRVRAHSRPQRPRSFWSAPRIETSGLSQFLSIRRVFVLQFSANQIRQI